MPISREELETILEDKFPKATITITDLAGDNDHWSAEIIDQSFERKSRIQQHQAVNNALKEEILSGKLHALQLKTSAK